MAVIWQHAPERLPEVLLRPLQMGWHDAWVKRGSLRHVLCCSRRIGKSYWCLVEATSLAMRKPGAIVRYAAPTAKQVRTIIRPNMDKPNGGVLSTCPKWLRPKWDREEGAYVFQNGSIIQIAGCDNGNHEALRGSEADLCIVDEAGFIDELGYVVKSVLGPQLLTVEDGRMLIASTPAKTPAHEFYLFDVEAQQEGYYLHATIHDAPHISEEKRAEFAKSVGGVDTTDWQREYLARWVVDENLAVVPEFSRVENSITCEWTRPEYFDAYVSMDEGFHDLTVVAFAYRDFLNRKTVIEDELVFRHKTSDVIAQAVAEKERALWGEKKPYLRIVDAAEEQIADLNVFHGVPSGRYAATVKSATRAELAEKVALPWCPARKDDAEAALNHLRIEIKQGNVAIHPRCEVIRLHLRTAIWNKGRTSYARSDEQVGHFDGVDAAKYLVRHVLPNKNPYPEHYRGETGATHWFPKKPAGALSDEGKALQGAFGRRTA